MDLATKLFVIKSRLLKYGNKYSLIFVLLHTKKGRIPETRITFTMLPIIKRRYKIKSDCENLQLLVNIIYIITYKYSDKHSALLIQIFCCFYLQGIILLVIIEL